MTNISATTSSALASTNATVLRDIKPPIEIPSPWPWIWIAIGAAILLAVIVGLILFLRNRKTKEVIAPRVPPHVRAKERLQEALALIGEPKPFCSAVSDTIRYYLEERFNFRAPERTTEEFLHELQATNLLLPDQKESLGEFLKQCDLVKFARYEPREAELRVLHESALRLVEETEPQAAPQEVETENLKTETPAK